MDDSSAIPTARLDLRPLSSDAVAALIAGEADRLEAFTGATVPRPLAPPPLMEDALPVMLERMRDDPAGARWWAPWLLRRRADGVALGAAGFAGGPDDEGAVTLGYCVYPEHEGRGFSSEAARALTEWALAQEGVAVVRATVPVGHLASRRVAERAGMVAVGAAHDDEVGEIVVYERRRPATDGRSAPEPPADRPNR